MPFSGPKWPVCPKHNLFGINHHYFHLSIGSFHFENLKNSYSQSRVMKMHHFLGPKWSTCSKQIFFGKFINIIVFYLLAPFIVQNFKKILSVDPELGGCAIFGSKMAHLPKWDFFKKTCFFFLICIFFIRNDKPKNTNSAVIHKHNSTS